MTGSRTTPGMLARRAGAAGSRATPVPSAARRRRRRGRVGAPPPARRRRGRTRSRLPVLVVQAPPLVGRRLRDALRRVLPLLLAPERGDVEVAPGAPHRLVAAGVDEVGAEHLVALAQEGVRAVPLA